MSNISKELLKSFNKKIFIEAGTHSGGTVDVALECGFEKIYSCEPAIERYNFCVEKFKEEIENDKVYLQPKSSKQFFEEILPEIEDEAVFWLDSHKDDNASGLQDLPPCPIIDELKIISQHKIKSHVILIDDIRVFRSQISWGKTTSVDNIKKMLLEINSEYKISFKDGRTKDDILVCKI
jgi:hypothetical protein